MSQEKSAVTAIGTCQFEELVLLHNAPVLVEFTAAWCAPCRMMRSVLQEVAGLFADRLRVVSLDVDQNAELADAFDVQSIPALMLIARGRLLGAWVGYQTAGQLAANVESALARGEVTGDA